MTRNLIHVKSAGINASIGKSESTIPIFLTIFVIAVVASSVRPCFNADSMLFVFKPVANICSSVSMFIRALAMSLIIEPHTLVYVSISVDQTAKSVCLIVLPGTLISGSIGPDLDSMTMLLAVVVSFASEHAAVGAGLGSPHSVELITILFISCSGATFATTWTELLLWSSSLCQTSTVLNLVFLFLLIDIRGNLLIIALSPLDGDFLFVVWPI